MDRFAAPVHDSAEAVRQWGAVHTKSRCEKKVEAYFQTRNVACFLPLIKHRCPGNREIRTFHVPLFPSYVFFDTAAISRSEVMACGRVVQILKSDEPERLKNELETLAAALKAEPSLVGARNKEIGTPVCVVAGQFKGLSGQVVRIDKRTRLLIHISLISQSACLEIDESCVEPEN